MSAKCIYTRTKGEYVSYSYFNVEYLNYIFLSFVNYLRYNKASHL